MSSDAAKPQTCQVDFYLLGDAAQQAGQFACRLAMMAWEQKQRIYIIAVTESSVSQLDEQMWQHPEQRFLPHTTPQDQNSGKTPVVIGLLSDLNPTDVVINLCPQAVPEPDRFKRVLEIVPFADDERQASRVKYKNYRDLGLKPLTHEISNG
jgi:DNA polymerase-3 subunit chi